VKRTHVVAITMYCAATVLLLLITGSVLIFAEGRQRLRLAYELNSPFPGGLTVSGLLWLASAVLTIILAYQLRARILASSTWRRNFAERTVQRSRASSAAVG
jgi:hypothetical protein